MVAKNFPDAVFRILSDFYGTQGWWPIVDRRTGLARYHVGAPRNIKDIFEIAIGAVLTQNIAWKNVVTALAALKDNSLLDPHMLANASVETIAPLIRPSGYYNQKAAKIKRLAGWFVANDLIVRHPEKIEMENVRRDLLEISGIGPETADSILLYGLNKKIFVVDAYTMRIFTRLGFLCGRENYEAVQSLFHKRFGGDLNGYREYHALIVAHGKGVCAKKPRCDDCCLAGRCAAICS